MPRDDADRIACTAFFETTLLHARVLNDFLTLEPTVRDKPDDIWAGDYLPAWQPPATAPLDRVPSVLKGRPVRDSINKQLAHFSLERVTHTKFWFSTVVDEVLADMKTFAEDNSNVCYAELAGVRLHDMRHTCASLAIRSGANVKVVQRLLGHKTATLTLDRYGHLYPDDLDAVATAFDSAADALRTIPALKAIVSAGSSL